MNAVGAILLNPMLMGAGPWGVALGGASLGLAGAGVAWIVVRRLPEPAQRPAAEPDATAGRSAPPVKELYQQIAQRPWFGPGLLAGSALFSGAVAGKLGLGFAGVLWVFLVPLLLALAIVDWRTHLLPTLIVRPATVAVIAAGTLEALLSEGWGEWQRAVIVMLVVRTFFWLLWFIRRAGMGFGDVRLSALLGFSLGWLGVSQAAIGIYAAFTLFAVPLLLVLVVRRERGLLKRQVPFGPFLVAGALLAVLAGDHIAAWLG